jgi:prepilin-type N-terminal cleavage/methylation domain-containing protein/prepilin-type processing-associated H-X9-DG protein
MGHRKQSKRHAFTLVELLVVIGIIAILMSVLLPTLASARKAANTVKCQANLRSIAQAMQLYVQSNKGYLPGSAVTTGAHLFNPGMGNANCPSVSHINDWQSPLGRLMRMNFPDDGDLVNRVKRFTYLMERPEFRCPENDLLAGPNGTPAFPVCQFNSYVLAVDFMYIHNDGGPWPASLGGASAEGETVALVSHNPPSEYVPKINKVGSPAVKVFMACGAKYSSATTPPSMPLSYRWDYGGSFADRGPWITAGTCWDRSNAPGNGGLDPVDPRMYGFRHGKKIQRSRGDSFRFTVAFYDGHVETMGDLQGANPSIWNPKGTEINTSRVWPDARKLYCGTAAGGQVYKVP